ncbi:MAG: asparagine synthase-related protein, partial [Deltaproteobacteria bacterium]
AGPRDPGFSHGPRWRSAKALERLFTADLRAATQGNVAVERLLASLPPEFQRWPPLAQDQYLEIRTLLSGYLLSSQGDRMLMAHSVEGRFPFLDVDVMALACSLPSQFKLRGLDEKHVLKRAASTLVPPRIVERPKQPYRSPNALAFTGDDAPDWVHELLLPRSISEVGVFDPSQIRRLWEKCRSAGPGARLSNADDMALVGVLSTQLLHHELVKGQPSTHSAASFRTVVDRLQG